MKYKEIAQKILEFVSKPTNFLLLVVIFILIFIRPIGCGRSVSTKNNGSEQSLKAKVIKLNDSLQALKVELRLVSSRDNLTKDSIIKEAIDKGVIKPDIIVRWREKYLGEAREIALKDSLIDKYNSILALNQKIANAQSEEERLLLATKYKKQTEELFAKRITFVDSNEFRSLKGNFGLDSKVNITEDIVISKPYIILGENKRFLNLGEPTFTAIIGNKNPLIKSDSIYATKFKLKPKTNLSFGPMVLTDGKDISAGIGINLRRKIFSFSLGYQLINTAQ
jgi:hypothetical protein